MSRKLLGTLCGFALSAMAMGVVDAQVPDTPQTRLRPIGSSGFTATPPSPTRQLRETGYQQNTLQPGPNPVRQTAMLQFEPPPLSNSGPMATPGDFGTLPSVAPPVTPALAPQTAPRGLPIGPAANAGAPVLGPGTAPMAQTIVPSNSDFAPVAQPQLNDGFATIDNCNCVSPPSNYVSATYGNFAPVSYQQPTAGMPAPVQVVPPNVVPTGVVPTNVVPTGVVAPPSAAPAGALMTFGQKALPISVAPGLYGQPVAYVQGQRFRNWFRYIFP